MIESDNKKVEPPTFIFDLGLRAPEAGSENFANILAA
jgi:hypothetical protein